MERPAFSILDLALDFLCTDPSGAEQYAWCENGREVLVALLDAVFELPADPSLLLDDLLRFSSALELELRSPSAAALLSAVLRCDARVIRLVDRQSAEETSARRAHWSGSAEVKRAPMRREIRRPKTAVPEDPRKRRPFRVSDPAVR